MPALPSVANAIKARIQWFAGGDDFAMSNLHFKYSGGPPATADLVSIANGILAAATTHIAPLQDADTGANLVLLTDLSSPTGAQSTSTGAPYGGTRTGGVLPASACAVVSGKIARRYRGGKPRTYLPAGTATDLAASKVWESAFVTAVETDWTAFISACLALSSGGTSLTNQINVSYYEGYTLGPASAGGFRKKIATPRAVPVVDVITSSKVLPTVGSQRRRNRDA